MWRPTFVHDFDSHSKMYRIFPNNDVVLIVIKKSLGTVVHDYCKMGHNLGKESPVRCFNGL